MGIWQCFGKLDIKKRKTIEIFGETSGSGIRLEYDAMRKVLTTKAKDMKAAFELLFLRFNNLSSEQTKLMKKYAEEFEKKSFSKAIEYVIGQGYKKESIEKNPPFFKTMTALDFLKSRKDTFGKPITKQVLDFVRGMKLSISYDVLIYHAPENYIFDYDIWGFLTAEEAKALGAHIKKRIKEMTKKALEEKLVKLLGYAGPGYELSDRYKCRADYLEALGNFLMGCKEDEIIVCGSR